ncbi:hypothetical protein AKO1_000463 [Acrasis kona]|uniref:VTC domain-containing protein n=1 Tax=Acrasis kona TaxID=1008807 RepID=A0AAW2ZR00_9EUKA
MYELRTFINCDDTNFVNRLSTEKYRSDLYFVFDNADIGLKIRKESSKKPYIELKIRLERDPGGAELWKKRISTKIKNVPIHYNAECNCLREEVYNEIETTLGADSVAKNYLKYFQSCRSQNSFVLSRVSKFQSKTINFEYVMETAHIKVELLSQQEMLNKPLFFTSRSAEAKSTKKLSESLLDGSTFIGYPEFLMRLNKVVHEPYNK